MAHELYTRTNQKIFFAGLALESLRKAETGEVLNAQALMQSEREAALFHLYGALLGLCHEVAGYYRLQQASVSRIELILNPTVLQASPTPELAELMEISSNSDSWLARLLAAYGALFQPPQPPHVTKVDPSLPLVDVVRLEDAAPALGHAELEGWRQQLKQLVLRYRESLSEC